MGKSDRWQVATVGFFFGCFGLSVFGFRVTGGRRQVARFCGTSDMCRSPLGGVYGKPPAVAAQIQHPLPSAHPPQPPPALPLVCIESRLLTAEGGQEGHPVLRHLAR